MSTVSVHRDRLQRRGARHGVARGGGAALAGRCLRRGRAQRLGRVRQESGDVVRQRRRSGLDRDGDRR